mgnify:CR=1 FL=1
MTKDRKNIWFKMYIDKITIKGSRVTLNNGGPRVHLNINNLDAPSVRSAWKGYGYVNLNTFYATALYGFDGNAPKIKTVKNYQSAKPLVVTNEGPSTPLSEAAFHRSWDNTLRALVGYSEKRHLQSVGIKGLAA